MRLLPLATLAAALLAACGGSRPATPGSAGAPEPLPSPPATVAVAKPPPSPATPEERVQAILPHWLDLLARGDDAAFLDEAIVPEELEKVLDRATKEKLVRTFKQDKHDRVVEALQKVRGATPTRVVDRDGRPRVTFELEGEPHHITFQVVGDKVYIEN